MESIEDELKREIDGIANDINNIENDSISDFLENAIDILLIKSANKNSLEGYDILITFGGPNIRIIYARGYAELIGTWGSAEYKKEIDQEAAENILEYLNEIYY